MGPLYVELDAGWQANAIIYWNAEPIGLYSETGPDRRFYIPDGKVRETNVLGLAVDGLCAPPRAGQIRVEAFSALRQLTIGFPGRPENGQ